MDSSTLTYVAYGLSALIYIVSFAGSDHLWKPSLSRKCLVAASICAISGVFLEIVRLLGDDVGMTLVVMFAPLIYLGYFQLLRMIFKQWFITEPHITSVSSSIGAPPLDLFTGANRDGKNRKYSKDRRVMAADFVFSFLQALVPAFTILALTAIVKNLNK